MSDSDIPNPIDVLSSWLKTTPNENPVSNESYHTPLAFKIWAAYVLINVLPVILRKIK
jgi:hypothetical protein